MGDSARLARERALDGIVAERADIDGGDMLGRVLALPEQCARASEMSGNVRVTLSPLRRVGLRHVVVVGMGGSAIGGDVVRAAVIDRCPVPVSVHRGFGLPTYVDASSVVIASSYSGNTVETLDASVAAAAKGAAVVAITSGGELAVRARARGWPLLLLPQRLPPRSAIGYSVVFVARVLEAIGLVPFVAEEWEEAVAMMQEMRSELGPNVPVRDNAAKRLAARLHGKLPVVYGVGPLGEVIAYRWKCQLNENAHTLAWSNVLPELNHNELVGWEQPAAIVRGAKIVMLRDYAETPGLHEHVDAMLHTLRSRRVGMTEVWSRGRGVWARLWSLLYFGDVVSVYSALLNGVDPTPVSAITDLKARLAGSD